MVSVTDIIKNCENPCNSWLTDKKNIPLSAIKFFGYVRYFQGLQKVFYRFRNDCCYHTCFVLQRSET